MSIKARNQHTLENRLIRLVLVFALVFATAHVALHDFDVDGGSLDVSSKCQLCRYNHVPVVASASPTSFIPLEIFAHFLPMERAQHSIAHQFSTLWARAPPLF